MVRREGIIDLGNAPHRYSISILDKEAKSQEKRVGTVLIEPVPFHVPVVADLPKGPTEVRAVEPAAESCPLKARRFVVEDVKSLDRGVVSHSLLSAVERGGSSAK